MRTALLPTNAHASTASRPFLTSQRAENRALGMAETTLWLTKSQRMAIKLLRSAGIHPTQQDILSSALDAYLAGKIGETTLDNNQM